MCRATIGYGISTEGNSVDDTRAGEANEDDILCFLPTTAGKRYLLFKSSG
jgi:hypothetical protein